MRPRRRRFRLVHALGILAVIGVGVALVGKKSGLAPRPPASVEVSLSGRGQPRPTTPKYLRPYAAFWCTGTAQPPLPLQEFLPAHF